MRFEIERDEFLNALTDVKGIEKTVKLKSSEAVLEMTTADRERCVKTTVSINKNNNGSAAVSAAKLHKLVKKFRKGETLKVSLGDLLEITDGKRIFRLSTLPGEDFPDFPLSEFDHHFRLPADDLRTLIDRTSFAVATEETHYYYPCGIYLHACKGKLRAVATDGHRLALTELPLPVDIPGVIIPRKTVNELRKLINKTDSFVNISLSESSIEFSFGQVVLNSKLAEGTYPDYERVIPFDNAKLLESNTTKLRDAVKRMVDFGGKKAILRMCLRENELSLETKDPDEDQAEEVLSVSYTDAPMEIGYNTKYLLDILQHVEGEKVRFQLDSPKSPILIKGVGDEDFFYIQMPHILEE